MDFYGIRNFEVYLTLFAIFVPILGEWIRFQKCDVLCENRPIRFCRPLGIARRESTTQHVKYGLTYTPKTDF